MAYIFDLSDQWNAGATVFTAIKMNVTDTASAAGSLLMDLQVGGSSYFTLRKDGRLEAGLAANRMIFDPATRSLILQNNAGVTNGGIRYFGSSSISMVAGSGYSSTFVDNGILNGAPGFVGWHGSTYSWEAFTPDLRLHRDAANTLAQRNGVNAQAFNLYNTYTDASNYERGFMRWTSNAFEIGTQAAGTGGGRDTRFVLGANALAISTASAANDIAYISPQLVGLASAIRLAWTSGTNGGSGFDAGIRRAAATVVQIDNGASTGAGGAVQLIEMTAPAAPSTDRVRIYAEDNGSGKTRLMALFATGAAQQIAIEP